MENNVLAHQFSDPDIVEYLICFQQEKSDEARRINAVKFSIKSLQKQAERLTGKERKEKLELANRFSDHLEELRHEQKYAQHLLD